MKEVELTVEDQLAISMPEAYVPTLNDAVAIATVAKSMGVEPQDELDTVGSIAFSLKYQAFVRYSYAAEMMKYRS